MSQNETRSKPRQQSSVLTLHPPQTLVNWKSMPGSWALLEVASRAHQRRDACAFFVSAAYTIASLRLDVSFPSPHLLPFQTSLASTFLKLLSNHHLASGPSSTTPDAAQHVQTQGMDLHNGLSMQTSFSEALVFVLSKCVDTSLKGESTANAGGLKHVASLPGGTNSAAAVRIQHHQDRCTSSQRQSKDSSSCIDGVGLTTNTDNCGSSNFEVRVLSHRLHQLSSIIMIGLIRISNWLLRHDAAQRSTKGSSAQHPEWLLIVGNSQPELRSVATSLLLQQSDCESWLSEQAFACLEGCVWGAYAREYLHGPLLPGCCYLGCSNLTGVSEAALPTLLCSGCRRVRYCSVACQRAAWVGGGHSTLCKE